MRGGWMGSDLSDYRSGFEDLVIEAESWVGGAIMEWISRNVEIQVKGVVENISREPVVVESIERALDNVYWISEEHSSHRYKVRNAGLVVLMVKLLRNSSKDMGTRLRSKALMALFSMAKDEENKNIMLREGVSRLAIPQRKSENML
ncbi:unnamed protein product [Linum trigynum]|uniref:Uncharacterized protein n=1 Tax=Linum trigynum TaxID=586398 RepID=A0AAV2FVE7_9ROSI